MSERLTHPAIERIERAVARIERASSARAFRGERLHRRHEVLRHRVEDAIAAIDSLIADTDGEQDDG